MMKKTNSKTKSEDPSENAAHSAGVAEVVLSIATNSLKRWDGGANLDEIIDSDRESPHSPIVADILFSYFRNKGVIDFAIAKFANAGKKRPAKPEIARILAVTLTQCFFQKGITPASAINVAVGVTRKSRGAKVAGFVNAVARRALDTGIAKIANSSPRHARLNIPELLLERWGENSDGSKAAANLAGIRPKLSFRVIKTRVSLEELEEIGCEKMILPEWADEFDFHSSEKLKELFDKNWVQSGKIYIQDPSTASACAMCSINKNDVILDLCSAPGGKTLMLAEKLSSGCVLIAADSSIRRQTRTAANLANAGFDDVAILAASALSPPFRAISADLVFIDAPCTNTGVFRKRPDALWSFTERKLRELTTIQRKILDHAVELAKPGGSIVYSTCSLEKEENSEMTRWFLRKYPRFSLESERQLLPSDLHDGAYAVRLRKGN